jgi:hypothetical protein
MGVVRMYENLRRRLDELFENAPKTRRAYELKEELLANLTDKYNDLVASGKSEDEAVNIAIAGIGDVDELIKGLGESDVLNNEKMQKDREKRALVTSISVGLYIMSIVVLILCVTVLGLSGEVSVCLMFTIIAIATSLIVYNSISRPKYVKADDTIVEEFKEWKSANSAQIEVLRSVKSIAWLAIVALYFILSFAFHAWAYSWIIFIIGAAIERIIGLVFELRK